MVRRLFVAATLVAVAIAVAAPGTAGAATKGACVLQGTASIPAGLATAAKPITYSFSGKFTNCVGTGAVKSGTVTASGAGTGSCTANNTAGVAYVYWNTGDYSRINFTTIGTGVLVRVVGKFTAGLFNGLNAKAFLGFYTTTPQACTTAGGLKVAKFAGPATVGI